MRILVNGLPYFSKKLVGDLNYFDPENRYVFLNTYESLWAKIKFWLYLPFYDKVLSMNGVSDESGSLNLVLRRKKPLIMLWQGTDVMLAVERFHNQTIYKKYIDHAIHFAVAPWLVEELGTIGINAGELSFIWLQPKENPEESPDEFAAMTYLAKGREEFYGWKVIKAAFEDLPNVKLCVVGSDGEGLEHPDNVIFCGWVEKDKMQELQRKNSVMLRMTDHDGNSHVVSEALAVGLDVIWNNPHPQTIFAKDSISLKKEIIQLHEKFITNGGMKNQENITWVKNNLDREKVLKNFIEKLKNA